MTFFKIVVLLISSHSQGNFACNRSGNIDVGIAFSRISATYKDYTVYRYNFRYFCSLARSSCGELGRGWSRASFESIEDANAIKSKMTVAMSERAGYSICVSVLGPEGSLPKIISDLVGARTNDEVFHGELCERELFPEGITFSLSNINFRVIQRPFRSRCQPSRCPDLEPKWTRAIFENTAGVNVVKPALRRIVGGNVDYSFGAEVIWNGEQDATFISDPIEGTNNEVIYGDLCERSKVQSVSRDRLQSDSRDDFLDY